jgi:UDP-glucose 4-epimerase
MNVLIIGGAGFLGANIIRHCLNVGAGRITVLDSLEPVLRSTTEHIESLFSDIQFVKGDVRDESLLRFLVAGQDVIINCAGQTSHVLSMQDPVLDVELNCVGNLILLETVRDVNPDATVIYTSSATVTGPADSSETSAISSERPLDIYSANKGVVEKYYRIYHTRYDLKTIVLRFANLFGPFGKAYSDFGFVNYFIETARSGGQLPVFGSGDQKRNLLYVADAADIIWKAQAEPRLFGATHMIAGPEFLSVREIAERIIERFGNGSLVHSEWPEDRARIEVGDVDVRSSLMIEQLGWTPSFTFDEGLLATIKAYGHVHPVGGRL